MTTVKSGLLRGLQQRLLQHASGNRSSEPFSLRRLSKKAVPARWSGQHPATKTFQAIRFTSTANSRELRMALTAVPGLLAPGGRLAVITFTRSKTESSSCDA